MPPTIHPYWISVVVLLASVFQFFEAVEDYGAIQVTGAVAGE